MAKQHNRNKITPEDLADLQERLAMRPAQPCPVVSEDTATLDAVIDLLILDGIIKGKDGKNAIDRIRSYHNWYGSMLTGLIMLLTDDGIINDDDLRNAIIVFHEGVRNFSPETSYDEISAWRRERLRLLRSKK